MNKNEIHIERLALEGDGVGRRSDGTARTGEAAFVAYSVPGETLEVRLENQKKHHSRWLPVRVITPSTLRQDPPCPYHFRLGHRPPWCGGCDWQQMPVPAQESAKRELVIETLTRLGGLPNPPVEPLLSSPSPWRYRNKVQVPFGRRGSKVIAGFFAPGTHEIVDFDDCLVQPKLSVELVRFVKSYATERRWSVYEEDRHRGWLRHLLVRTNEAGQAIIALVTAQEPFHDGPSFVKMLRSMFPQVIGVHQNVQPARTNVILGPRWKRLWGDDKISEEALGLKLSFSIGSFFQVNTRAAERLYEKAIAELGPSPNMAVVDVYCGVGAMTLAAARRSAYAVGIESASGAVRDAEANARANNVLNARFFAADAARAMGTERGLLGLPAGAPLGVIVDPPRAGCEAPVLEGLLALKPERIVYVSCHPGTLARDIKILSPAYRVARVTPVDLFPQTAHIESVTLLERRDGAA